MHASSRCARCVGSSSACPAAMMRQPVPSAPCSARTTAGTRGPSAHASSINRSARGRMASVVRTISTSPKCPWRRLRWVENPVKSERTNSAVRARASRLASSKKAWRVKARGLAAIQARPPEPAASGRSEKPLPPRKAAPAVPSELRAAVAAAAVRLGKAPAVVSTSRSMLWQKLRRATAANVATATRGRRPWSSRSCRTKITMPTTASAASTPSAVSATYQMPMMPPSDGVRGAGGKRFHCPPGRIVIPPS